MNDALPGAYTAEIKCKECGQPRKVKPQDAWQVKLCIPCQAGKNAKRLDDLKKKKKDPTAIRAAKETKLLQQLDNWTRQNKEDVAALSSALKRLNNEHAKTPKLKRIWP